MPWRPIPIAATVHVKRSGEAPRALENTAGLSNDTATCFQSWGASNLTVAQTTKSHHYVKDRGGGCSKFSSFIGDRSTPFAIPNLAGSQGVNFKD